MPYPEAPTPAKSYTAHQQSQGDNRFPGTFLDTDFQNLRINADDVSEFLQVAHNEDGTLKNSAIPPTGDILDEAAASAAAALASQTAAAASAAAAAVSEDNAADSATDAAASAAAAALLLQPTVFDTLVDLRQSDPTSSSFGLVADHDDEAAGGGGYFIWNATSTEADNDGTVASQYSADLAAAYGEFPSTTGWTLGTGWDIPVGTGNLSRTSGSGSTAASHLLTMTAGRTYRIIYSVSAFGGTNVSRSFNTRLTGGSTVTGTTHATPGVWTDDLVAASGNTAFGFVATQNTTITIDWFRIYELTATGRFIRVGETFVDAADFGVHPEDPDNWHIRMQRACDACEGKTLVVPYRGARYQTRRVINLDYNKGIKLLFEPGVIVERADTYGALYRDGIFGAMHRGSATHKIAELGPIHVSGLRTFFGPAQGPFNYVVDGMEAVYAGPTGAGLPETGDHFIPFLTALATDERDYVPLFTPTATGVTRFLSTVGDMNTGGAVGPSGEVGFWLDNAISISAGDEIDVAIIPFNGRYGSFYAVGTLANTVGEVIIENCLTDGLCYVAHLLQYVDKVTIDGLTTYACVDRATFYPQTGVADLRATNVSGYAKPLEGFGSAADGWNTATGGVALCYYGQNNNANSAATELGSIRIANIHLDGFVGQGIHVAGNVRDFVCTNYTGRDMTHAVIQVDGLDTDASGTPDVFPKRVLFNGFSLELNAGVSTDTSPVIGVQSGNTTLANGRVTGSNRTAISFTSETGAQQTGNAILNVKVEKTGLVDSTGDGILVQNNDGINLDVEVNGAAGDAGAGATVGVRLLTCNGARGKIHTYGIPVGGSVGTRLWTTTDSLLEIVSHDNVGNGVDLVTNSTDNVLIIQSHDNTVDGIDIGSGSVRNRVMGSALNNTVENADNNGGTTNNLAGLTISATAAPSVRNMNTGGLPARLSTDGTNLTITNTELYVAELEPGPAQLATGVSVFVGAATNGNMKVCLFDASGARVGISASTDVSAVTADTYKRIAFTAPVQLQANATYYVGVICDDNTNDINTHVFGDFIAGKITGLVYATEAGYATITLPAGFTTGLGPIASLY